MSITRRRAAIMISLLVPSQLVLPIAPVLAPIAQAVTITVPSAVVIETTTAFATAVDPNRCVAAAFVQFEAAPGEAFGTLYYLSIPDGLLGEPWMDFGGPGTGTFYDDYTIGSGTNLVTWTAPPGTHRFYLAGGSSGAGCAGMIADTQARWGAPTVTVDVELAASFVPVPFGPGEFQFTSSVQGGRAPYRYEWNYGNGETGQGALGSVLYAQPGTYAVSLTVTDADGLVANSVVPVAVAAPELNVTVDYAHDGDKLALNTPTDVVVKVAAGGAGVGALTGLTFVGGVLGSVPSGGIDIVAGPTPAPGAGFELQPGTSKSFVLTVVPRTPTRLTLGSDVAGLDAAGRAVTDHGELVELLSPLEVTVTPSVSDVVKFVADGTKVVVIKDKLGEEHTVFSATVRVKNAGDTDLVNVHLVGPPNPGVIEELAPGDTPHSNSVLAADDPARALDVPDQPDGIIGPLAAGAFADVTYYFEALRPGTSPIEALVGAGLATGETVTGLGSGKVRVIEEVLVELRVKPDPNQLPPRAGQPVRLIAELKNLSADKVIGVVPQVYYGDDSIPGGMSNATNGYLFAESQTVTPTTVQGFELQPGQPAATLRGLAWTLPTDVASNATLTYELKAYEFQVDEAGNESWKDISQFARVVNDAEAGWSNPVRQRLLPNPPENFDPATSCGQVWGAEYADWTWCGMTAGIENFVTGITQLPALAVSLGEWTGRQYLYEAKLLGMAFEALVGDEQALAELTAEAKKAYATVSFAIADPDGLNSQLAGAVADYIANMDRLYRSGDPNFLFEVGKATGENIDFFVEAPLKLGLKAATTFALRNVMRPIANSRIPKAITAMLESRYAAAARRIEQGESIAKAAVPGMDAAPYLKRLGYGDRVREALYEACAKFEVVCVFKTRDEYADELIDSGRARPKSEQFKQKTVKKIDMDRFGIPEEYAGRPVKATAVVIEVPFAGQLDGLPGDPKLFTPAQRQTFKNAAADWVDTLGITDPEEYAITLQHAQTRAIEYLHFRENMLPHLDEWRLHGVGEMFRPSTQVGQGHAPTELVVVDFDAVEVARPGQPRFWQLLTGTKENPGKLLPHASDPDPVFFLDPDTGEIADPAKRLAIMEHLYADPRVGTNHGETGSLLDLDGALMDKWMPKPEDVLIVVHPDRTARFARVLKVNNEWLPTTSKNWLLIDGSKPIHHFLAAGWDVPQLISDGFDLFAQSLGVFGAFSRLGRFAKGAYTAPGAPGGQPEPVETFNRQGAVLGLGPDENLATWSPPSAPAAPLRAQQTQALAPPSSGWTPIDYTAALADGTPEVLDPAPFTYLAQEAAAGADELDVALPDELGLPSSVPWFQPLDRVVIDPGGAHEEIVTVAALGSLILQDGVRFDHQAGEMVALVNGVVPPPNALTVDVGATSVVEGSGPKATVMRFTVSLSAPAPAGGVAITFATTDQSATRGQDYVKRSGTLRFAAGETTKSIDVQVVADRRAEPTETFALTLADPVGVELGVATAIGTIVDDDQLRVTIARSVCRAEPRPGTSATYKFVVSLSASAPVGGVSVDFATRSGTATAGADFDPSNGTLHISAGHRTGTIRVTVRGDRAKEADEDFFVDLLATSNSTVLGDPHTARGIISTRCHRLIRR